MVRNSRELRRDAAPTWSLDRTGLIAVAATALAGAAIYYLMTSRSWEDTRSRLLEGDVGRRLRDTMEEIGRLAEQGAAYVERRAADVRHAIETRTSPE
jgi:hypothetical protein